MERSHILRNVVLFLATSLWAFLLISLGSFHPTDWPSHAVFPYPPTQNLCGSAGAYVAYYLFVVLGQGVFPMLFFTGVVHRPLRVPQPGERRLDPRSSGCCCSARRSPRSSTTSSRAPRPAFPRARAASSASAPPASSSSTSAPSARGSCCSPRILIGLVLAADDLVLHAPGFVAFAASSVKDKAPALQKIKFNFPALPKLPALPGFVTRDVVAKPGRAPLTLKPRPTKPAAAPTPTKPVEDDDEDFKPQVMLKRDKADAAKSDPDASRGVNAKGQEPTEDLDARAESIAAALSNVDPSGAGSGTLDLEYPNDEDPAGGGGFGSFRRVRPRAVRGRGDSAPGRPGGPAAAPRGHHRQAAEHAQAAADSPRRRRRRNWASTTCRRGTAWPRPSTGTPSQPGEVRPRARRRSSSRR